jgi:hypothetical protein
MHMYFKSVLLASVCYPPYFDNLLYSHVQISTSMILEEPSILASKPWSTIPFQQNHKMPLDTLLDIMHQLPSCFPYQNEMLKMRCKNPPASDAARQNLASTLQHVLHRLDQFWETHKSEIDPKYDDRVASQIETGHYHTIEFESPYAATVTSLYDSANVIVFTSLASASCTPDTYYWKATIHAASILASIAFHEAQGPLSGGSFSMLFPMRIISLMSPSQEQRVVAHEALVRWGKDRGLAGVCITRVTSPESVMSYQMPLVYGQSIHSTAP